MTVLIAGITAIAVIAVVVRVVDLVRAPHWRDVAAQRRQAWEASRDAGPDPSPAGADDLSGRPGWAARRRPDPVPTP